MGFGPGDRIGLLARNHVQAIEVMTATSAVGIDLVPGNTGPAGPQLAVVPGAAGRQGAHPRRRVRRGRRPPARVDAQGHRDRAGQPGGADRAARLPPGPGEGGRTVILTSGTTGTPKGAARKTPGGFGPLISIIDRIPLRAHDRILISAPIFHTGAMPRCSCRWRCAPRSSCSAASSPSPPARPSTSCSPTRCSPSPSCCSG
uniref:AMP-binding protein n=2 Tax=Janibacter limosus TaxID=53458 RepID=A0AC61U2I3_9MICO